jgi:hypothetical protein
MSWNAPSSNTLGNHTASVCYTSVALHPTKAIRSVTLPPNANVHVFAMSVNSLRGALNNVAISDSGSPGAGNLDGKG